MSDVEENSVASGEQEEKIEVNIAEETTKVREQFKEGLTTLSKTADNSSYAYVHLNASEKEIENVYEALQFYPHVRYLNLSTNQIKEVPHIEKMHSLLLAELQSNTIESALFTGLPNHLVYLQSLNLNQNRIKELPESLQLPRLKKLSLNENEITSLSFLEGHKSLVTLEARKNQLVNLVGLCRLPRLTEIFLAENSIASFKGIGILPKLTFLHLRNNHIKIIPDDLIDQPKLVKLNLRENAIDVKEETLKLLNLSKLNDLSLQENPFEETLDGDARRNLIMLICLDKEKGAQIRNSKFEIYIAQQIFFDFFLFFRQNYQENQQGRD